MKRYLAATAGILAFGLASGAYAFTIDTFNNTDGATQAGAGGPALSLGVNGALDILQGIGGRNLSVNQITAGSAEVKIGSNVPNPGLLSYSQDSGVIGNFLSRWDNDGTGAEAGTLEFLSTAVDLTDAGSDDRIRLRVISSDFAANITFVLYDGDGGTATLTQNALAASLLYDLDYQFSSFALAGGFVAADFAAVKAIDLRVNDLTNIADVDLRVDLIESTNQNPEPGTLALFGLSMAGLGILQNRRRRRS